METDWVWIIIIAVFCGGSILIAEHFTPLAKWPKFKRALALGLIVGVVVFILNFLRTGAF